MKRFLNVLALAALATASAAAANITFLTWSDSNIATPLIWTGNSYTASIPVQVTLQTAGIQNSSIIPAVYDIPVGTTFTATMYYTWTPTGTLTGTVGNQSENYKGSVTLKDDARIGATNLHILDAVFANAQFTGIDTTGNTGLNWKASISGGMTYWSNIMSFVGLTGGSMAGQSSDAANMGSGQIDATVSGTLDSWQGTASGSFSSNPIAQAVTPEPSTFAMLGTALVAAGLFGRKRFAKSVAR